MSYNSASPVFTGLAVGAAFVIMLSVFSAYFPVNVKLKEEWDREGQRKAVDVLLTNPDVRTFILGKTFEVWAFGSNFPQASLNEGICDKGECTLIGIRERNVDGSVDCALKTFVNVETNQVDDVQYSTSCDEDRANVLSGEEYRALLSERRRGGYDLAESDPRVMKAIQGSLFTERDFEMLDRRDVVTIETTKALSITGSWQEGYQFNLSGRKFVEISIVEDSITSVNIKGLPDEHSYWNFTDNEKRMISIAFSYPQLQSTLSGMSDGTDYYISAIRDRGMGDLGYVIFATIVTREPLFMVTVNQVTGEVVQERSFELEGEG